MGKGGKGKGRDKSLTPREKASAKDERETVQDPSAEITTRTPLKEGAPKGEKKRGDEDGTSREGPGQVKDDKRMDKAPKKIRRRGGGGKRKTQDGHEFEAKNEVLPAYQKKMAKLVGVERDRQFNHYIIYPF